MSLDVVLEDDVKHAGDGVGAVDGGRAVFEDLDAGDGVDGDHVEIHELGGTERGGGAALGEGRMGDAAAVEEDEGGVGAEAAEGDGGGAGEEVLTRFSPRLPAPTSGIFLRNE